MDHDEWLELVSAEADGELDAPESERLAAHLADCRSCTALLGSFESSRRRIRVRTASAGDHLVAEVLAARSRQRLDEVGAQRILVRRAGIAAAGVAAAVAALILLAPGSPATAPLTPREPGDALIAATDQSFDSADIEIEQGTTVEWRNAGSTTHHLVRDLGGAKVDEDLLPGRTETATFGQPGTLRGTTAPDPPGDDRDGQLVDA